MLGWLLVFALAQEPRKTQPKSIECTVETNSILTCFDEEAEREFPLTITPATEQLKSSTNALDASVKANQPKQP